MFNKKLKEEVKELKEKVDALTKSVQNICPHDIGYTYSYILQRIVFTCMTLYVKKCKKCGKEEVVSKNQYDKYMRQVKSIKEKSIKDIENIGVYNESK